MRIKYQPGLPEMVAKSVEKFIPGVERHLPSWLRELELRWSEDNTDNSILAVGCQHQYRRAWIIIYPPFLSRTLEEQLTDIKHELGHLHEWQIDVVVQDMLTFIKEKNPDLESHFRRTYARELEAFCEDFGHLF